MDLDLAAAMCGDAPPDTGAVHVTITGPPERAAAVKAWIIGRAEQAGGGAAGEAEPVPGGLRIHLTVDVPDT